VLISLDIDGVLADEDGFLEGIDPSRRAGLALTHGYYMERRPLWTPTREEGSAVFKGCKVQIVSKRPRWVEATSLIWIQAHYPWMVPLISGIAHVGPTGSKVHGLTRPDVAIDDSFNAITEYRSFGIPCIAVASTRGGYVPDVPSVARVDDAVVTAKSLFMVRQ
jgi:hypothetical protein